MTHLHDRINRLLFAFFVVLSILIAFRHLADFEGGVALDNFEESPAPPSYPSRKPQLCGTLDSNNSAKPLRLIGIPWSDRQFHHFVPSRRTDVKLKHPLVLAARHDAENFVTTVLIDSAGCVGSIQMLFSHHEQVAVRRKLSQKLRPGTSPDLEEKYCLPSESFRIRIVGPEIESHVSSKCWSTATPVKLFEYNFSVASSGTYHVEGEWMYSDYAAFDEKSTATIPMIRKSILPVVEEKGKFGEILNALHHDPALNLYNLHHSVDAKLMRRSKFRSSKNFVWDQFTFRTNLTFSCSAITEPMLEIENSVNCFSAPKFGGLHLSDEFGRWSQRKVLSDQSGWDPSTHPLAHTHFERSYPAAIYQYAPLGSKCPKGLQAVSPDQLLDTINRRYAARTDLKVTFIGDSHTRVSFIHFKNFLAHPCQMEEHRVKSMAGRQSRVSTASGKHEAILTYVNDVLLDEFARNGTFASASDVVVLGMGSWALGGRGPDPLASARAPENYGRWSAAEYAHQMEAVGSAVKALLVEDPFRIVVWMTIPAYPHNGRRFARLKGEHRTNPKIQLFNRIAVDVLLRVVGVPLLLVRLRIVDQFDVTYPVMHLSLDHNHHTTYAQDAILHLLLNALLEQS